MNILAVDDHPEFLASISEELEDCGHQVTRCVRADEAVAALARIGEYDLVILDIMMRLGSAIEPGEASETGIAIYRRLRRISIDVPVVVISAKSKDRFWKEEGFSKDHRAVYFAKPLKAEENISQIVARLK
jgi:CheY-like chemotaxis protein